VNVIEYALASQDARLAALKAQAQAPSVDAIKAATLGALLRVEADPLGWANLEDVADAIEAAWKQLEAG
jgi:hypothetical protein